MDHVELAQFIKANYESREAFRRHFNRITESDVLDKSKLSKQLSGTIKVSAGWSAAYLLFAMLVSPLVSSESGEKQLKPGDSNRRPV